MSEATAVRERPILFSGPMVRAILDGRKTVTRRVVNITHRTPGLAAALLPPAGIAPRPRVAAELCPYGQPGDRLWVRETWRPSGVCHGQWVSIHYRADDRTEDRPYQRVNLADRRWRPSIHMPRWASRITLEVTGVRVERLQEITEEGAIAEGVENWGRQDGAPYPHYRFAGCVTEHDAAAVFAQLWDALNAKRGHPWESNPWVWVIEFRRADAA